MKSLILLVALTAAIMLKGSAVASSTAMNTATEASREKPHFTADKLLILHQLQRREYVALDVEFEQFQKEFEKNPASESNEQLAYDSFATDEPSTGNLIADWIKARPRSYAAHLAMGFYNSWRGWHSRGPAVASATPSQRFEKMRDFFSESSGEVRKALRIKSKLSIGYAILLGEARGASDHAQMEEVESEALAKVPDSFVVREQIMESLFPRWGGNHDLMREFAEQSQAVATKNPEIHCLLGFVDLDEGETLGIHGKIDESIVALTRAIQVDGEYWRFYFSRGIGYAYKQSYQAALSDLDRANALSPQDPEILIRRAYVLAELGKPQRALADLEFVKVFKKPDNEWNAIHDRAMKALATKGS
jgi:tetratricopeptide (TPR) repeat protein